MPKLVFNSEQAVSEWSKIEWLFLIFSTTLALTAVFLSIDNIAALVVWMTIFLTAVFATTLVTYKVVINWNAHHVSASSIWGKILEITNFDELESILITLTHSDGDINFGLALVCKTGSKIELNSYKSKKLAQHDAELLASLMRLRKCNIKIKSKGSK